MTDQPEPPAPNRRLVLLRRAEAEIEEGRGWYEEQAPGLGRAFVLAVDATLTGIQEYPAAHAEVRPRVRRALVRGFPYGVFYTEYPDRIIVLAVVHARRHPRRWPSRPTR
jgi:plasmid stabilization system protein ParE